MSVGYASGLEIGLILVLFQDFDWICGLIFGTVFIGGSRKRFRSDISSGITSALLLLLLVKSSINLPGFYDSAISFIIVSQGNSLHAMLARLLLMLLITRGIRQVISDQIIVLRLMITTLLSPRYEIFGHISAVVLFSAMQGYMFVEATSIGLYLLFSSTQCLLLSLFSWILGSSITFGEGIIISSVSAMFLADFMLILCHQVLNFIGWAPDFHRLLGSIINHSEKNPILILSYGLFWGMCLIGLSTSPLLKHSFAIHRDLKKKESNKASSSEPPYLFTQFLLITFLIVFLILDPLMYVLIRHEPFLWTIQFCFLSENVYRTISLVYWIFCVLLVLFLAPGRDDSVKTAADQGRFTDLRRKFFHIVVVILFIPVFKLGEIQLLNLALSVALTLFLFLEFIRSSKLQPLGLILDYFIEPYLDERDKLGVCVLSHMYLLIGCALPIWLESIRKSSTGIEPSPFSLCGVLALGIGDALASTVGKKYGTLKWPGLKKSVQGSAAFIAGLYFISVLTFDVGLVNFHLFLACTLCGLLEAFSEQNDNLIIPLYYYSLCVRIVG